MLTTCKYSKSVFALVIYLVMATVAMSAAKAATFTVTKTADTNDGICDADCSLREAIATANAAPTDDVINFDASVFAVSQTITLSGTGLSVNNKGTLTINGTGANLLKISGSNAINVFSINAGTNNNGATNNQGHNDNRRLFGRFGRGYLEWTELDS